MLGNITLTRSIPYFEIQSTAPDIPWQLTVVL